MDTGLSLDTPLGYTNFTPCFEPWVISKPHLVNKLLFYREVSKILEDFLNRTGEQRKSFLLSTVN